MLLSTTWDHWVVRVSESSKPSRLKPTLRLFEMTFVSVRFVVRSTPEVNASFNPGGEPGPPPAMLQSDGMSNTDAFCGAVRVEASNFVANCSTQAVSGGQHQAWDLSVQHKDFPEAAEHVAD